MVGAGRVAGRRSDAAVVFFDESLVGQTLVGGVGPEFAPDTLVHTLGECFGEAVGEGLGHDGAIVVVGGLEGGGEFVSTKSGGYDEGPDVVEYAGVAGCDEVGEAEVVPGDAGALVGFVCLLAEEVEGCEDGVAGVVGVEMDVVSDGVGGVEADHRAGGECLEGDYLVEEVPGVSEESAGLASVGGVPEDRGVGSAQFPGEEEWGPVYVVHELVEGVVVEDAGSGEGGSGGDGRGPVEGLAAGTSFVYG